VNVTTNFANLFIFKDLQKIAEAYLNLGLCKPGVWHAERKIVKVDFLQVEMASCAGYFWQLGQ
jgi:hypothetical protein